MNAKFEMPLALKLFSKVLHVFTMFTEFFKGAYIERNRTRKPTSYYKDVICFEMFASVKDNFH